MKNITHIIHPLYIKCKFQRLGFYIFLKSRLANRAKDDVYEYFFDYKK